MVTLDDVTEAMQNTRVTPTGVSFAGQSLKLNNAEDAEVVVQAINNCEKLEFLNLEGNTLGVDAAEAIAKALEKKGEFKRALWKDMFTGRMKAEIPKALEYLGNGLVTAGARLTELDLSDNAFGPIGVQGLGALLRSSSCYALEELRLNNNGLGITGGNLLASALLECHQKSGGGLALRVFIAGRNRLENDGAKALAEVFKTLGTLEHISLPQNGIYHPGITSLSHSLAHNPHLHTLNLNDNTVGPLGCKALTLHALPHLPLLRSLNLGDCLIKSGGAVELAGGLVHCPQLEGLVVGFNEIGRMAAVGLVGVVRGKGGMRVLEMGGNQLGGEGRREVRELLRDSGKFNILGSLSDDESGASDDEEEQDGDNDGSDEEESSQSSEEEEVVEIKSSSKCLITADEFVKSPTADSLLALGDSRTALLINEAMKLPNNFLETFVPILMKVGALCVCKPVIEVALKTSETLYIHLFTWSQKTDNLSILNNALLVNLGLIKSEEKKFKPTWNLEGCLVSLESILDKNFVPQATKDTLKVFMKREIENEATTNFFQAKKKVLAKLT